MFHIYFPRGKGILNIGHCYISADATGLTEGKALEKSRMHTSAQALQCQELLTCFEDNQSGYNMANDAEEDPASEVFPMLWKTVYLYLQTVYLYS